MVGSSQQGVIEWRHGTPSGRGRNVMRYEDRAINQADLNQILEAGRRNTFVEQRWDFVVMTAPERLDRLSGVWRVAGQVADSAATIALVAPDADSGSERESIQYDLGQLTMSIMLAAMDVGVGRGHSAVQDQSLTREILGFPKDPFCAWLTALGYPADRPLEPIENPERRPFDSVVHEETW